MCPQSLPRSQNQAELAIEPRWNNSQFESNQGSKLKRTDSSQTKQVATANQSRRRRSPGYFFIHLAKQRTNSVEQQTKFISTYLRLDRKAISQRKYNDLTECGDVAPASQDRKSGTIFRAGAAQRKSKEGAGAVSLKQRTALLTETYWQSPVAAEDGQGQDR